MNASKEDKAIHSKEWSQIGGKGGKNETEVMCMRSKIV